MRGLSAPESSKSLHRGLECILEPAVTVTRFRDMSREYPLGHGGLPSASLPAGPFDWWLSPCRLHLHVPLLTPPMSLEMPLDALRQGRPCGSAGWRGSDRQAWAGGRRRAGGYSYTKLITQHAQEASSQETAAPGAARAAWGWRRRAHQLVAEPLNKQPQPCTAPVVLVFVLDERQTESQAKPFPTSRPTQRGGPSRMPQDTHKKVPADLHYIGCKRSGES